MTGRRWPGSLLLRDLVTAAALLWLTLSDDWLAIGVAAGLVVSRVLVGPHHQFGARSGSRTVHERPSSG